MQALASKVPQKQSIPEQPVCLVQARISTQPGVAAQSCTCWVQSLHRHRSQAFSAQARQFCSKLAELPPDPQLSAVAPAVAPPPPDSAIEFDVPALELAPPQATQLPPLPDVSSEPPTLPLDPALPITAGSPLPPAKATPTAPSWFEPQAAQTATDTKSAEQERKNVIGMGRSQKWT